MTLPINRGIANTRQEHADDHNTLHAFFNEHDGKVAHKPTGAVVLRFVASDGDDANDGLSWGTPKATLQAAADSVPAGVRATVHVGSGTWVLPNQPSPVGTQYTYSGVISPSNIAWVAAPGWGTILQHAPIAATGFAQHFTAFTNSDPTNGNENIHIEGFLFDLSYPVLTTSSPFGMERYATAVYFAGVKHCRVRRNWIKNGAVGFIPGPTTVNTPAAFDQNFDNVVSDNIMQDLTMSIFLYQGRQMWCERNWLDRSWDDPILIGSAAKDVWVRGNYVNASPVESGKGGTNGSIYVLNDGGIDSTAESMDGIWITDNRVWGNKNRDAALSGAMSGIGLSKSMRNVWVERNNISDCNRGIQFVDGDAQDIVIRGNSIHHCEKHGIRAQANLAGAVVRGLVIDDNIIYNNQLDASSDVGGIEVYCGTTGTISGAIRRNHIYDDQGVPTQTTALRMGGEATATPTWDISNNNLSGTVAAIGTLGAGALKGCRIKDNVGYNPQGLASIAVGASPFVYTAGPTPEIVYITGGTVTAVQRAGANVLTTTNVTVPMEPNEVVTIFYTAAPTMRRDRK